MTGFLERPSVSAVRRIGRILGTLLGLFLLAEFIEWVTGTNPPTAIRDYLIAVGCVMIVLGFAVGWFKDLAAFLLVLGGSAVVCVVTLLPPAGNGPCRSFLSPPSLASFFSMPT